MSSSSPAVYYSESAIKKPPEAIAIGQETEAGMQGQSLKETIFSHCLSNGKIPVDGEWIEQLYDLEELLPGELPWKRKQGEMIS